MVKTLVEYTHTHTHTGSLKNKKGITLIALVITIIVLLILSGVSIATLTGDNGILSRAKTAGEKNQEVEAEEKDRLSLYEDAIDNWNTRSEVSKDETIIALGKKIEALEAANSYSTTEEKIIGKWIDGKPIYRKVFTNLNINLTARNWYDTGISIIDWNIPIRIVGYAEGTDNFSVDLAGRNKDNTLKIMATGMDMGTFTKLIVEYTKTTD